MKKISITLGLLTIATAVAAQSSPITGPRWAAYAGCWEPASIDGQDASAINPRVCVVPTSDLGADLISILNNKVTDRSHVEVDGARRQVSAKGCSGWESASFSKNGRRIYFESEQSCEFNVQRKTSGLFAVGSSGRWTNIVDVSAGGGHSLRAIHYAPLHVDSTFPPEIVTAIGDREQAIIAARIAARSAITINEVMEASKAVSPGVLDAWIASEQQAFDLDANTLVRLADNGVKPSTIDIMIAVSHPDLFHVSPTGATTQLQPEYVTNQRARANYDYCYGRPIDPWGYYDYGSCSPYFGFIGYSPYGYGYGYGYNPYYYGGYNYSGPTSVIVVVNGSDNQPKHGKMTKGGYTTSSTSSSGATTDRTSSGTSSGSSGSSGSSSGSSGSSSGSSGSSSGRTAHPKPPESDGSAERAAPSRTPRDEAADPSTPRSTTSASSSSATPTGRTAVPKPPAR